MNITEPGKGNKVNINLDAEIMLNNGITEMVKIVFHSGQTLPLHPNAVDVVFAVMSGNGTFLYEEKEIPVEQGTLIQVEKNSRRGWVNNSDNDLSILVIKMLSL